MKLGDLFIKLGLQKQEFDKGLTDAKQQTSAFGSAMKKLGGLMAGVFAADKIIQFGKEVFQVATQAEGVQTAFAKIGSAQDLEILRRSVKGTVSDLELMKRAVMASNFGIPVQELGRLFEFASKRAQDTGQSVDYLVDSIVTGIGRKSPLILDNLGISAVALKQKLNGVGLETASVADITRAVGQIAEESFSKTGRLADTLGTKITSITVKWENFKLSLTQSPGFNEFWSKELDEFDKNLTILFSKNISRWEKFKSLIDIFGNETDYLYNKAKLGDNVDKWLNMKEEESSGAPWEKPKADPIVKTAKEQLEAIRKVNDELEAQRILRQEFKGQKLSPLTGIGTNVGDTMLGQTSVNLEGVFGNMDSSYKMTLEKQKKFTEEYLQDWNDFAAELNSEIQYGLADAIESLASGFGEMLATGQWNWSDFGKGILQTIGQFLQQLGGLMIAYGLANLKFFKALTSGPNPLGAGLAIAAGVGLIAAGAAVASFAKGGISGAQASAVPASGYSNYSQSNAVAAIAGNVVFELQGTMLKGVLNNVDRKNQLIR